MRILAILIMTMTAAVAVEWTASDLPEDSSEDFRGYIISQQKILSDAQEDLEKLRDRLIRNLERDLRKYERKDDTKAVAAIKALIEAQKGSTSVVDAGQSVVTSGIPVDHSNPETIFDTSTIEERKAKYEAQKEWEKASIKCDECFFIISNEDADLIDKSEFLKVMDFGVNTRLYFSINDIKTHGPTINLLDMFSKVAPNTTKKGVVPIKILLFDFRFNSEYKNNHPNGENVIEITNELNIIEL